MPMRGDGSVYHRPDTGRWWITYVARGKRQREPGGRTEAEAKKKLRVRLRDVLTGEFHGLEEERVTVDQLLDALLTHLEVRGAASLVNVKSHIKPVRAALGHLRAVEVTTAMVEDFARRQLAAKKARATVNKKLQPLQQAFNLARKQGRLTRTPYIPRLREDNARQGFFEAEDFEAVVATLPNPVDDIARFAYLSGWRKGEILSLGWEGVDRKAREVRLKTSKNGYGRMLPLEGILWEVMERRWAARKFDKENGVRAISEYVFHRKGQPITEFRKSWATACKSAGVPGKFFHDLRRTAVRNMIRAGVPQSVAMSISGHRTASMFLRYNITSDEDCRQALRSVQAHVIALRNANSDASPTEISHRSVTVGKKVRGSAPAKPL